MGNKQSYSIEFTSACRKFSQSELQDLKSLFVSLAAQSQSRGEYISASVFQAYFGIHGSLGSRLYELVSQGRHDRSLYYEDLVVVKAIYEKGSPDEIERFIFQLVDLLSDGVVQRSEIEAVVLSTLETVLGPAETMPGVGLPENSIQSFVNAANFSIKVDGKEPGMSLDDFQKWCFHVPSFKRFLSGLMTIPSFEQTPSGRQVPHLRFPENVNPVLRKEFAWHIAGVLKQEDAREWSLLYHSSLHGCSFTTFLNKCLCAGCPSILLIKDQDENIFGGYASYPWERHPDFYGDMKSFLFTLQPKAAIYRPSGANSNLQWCAANYMSDSIPNGIGFGGQINHFGIFIPEGFDAGFTFPTVTYGNPSFSASTKFSIDVIECWGLLNKSDEGNKGYPASEGTILQRFKEDRNMLNMVGLANASDSAG